MTSSPQQTPERRGLDASLGRYAVAATAALSATVGAEAAITNLTFTGGFSMPGLNDSGSFDFSDSGINISFTGERFYSFNPGFFYSTPSGFTSSSPGSTFVSARINAGGANVAFVGGSAPGKLAFGAAINDFGNIGETGTLLSTSGGWSGFGNFNDGLPGYLGFRANIGSDTFVGWLRVSIGLSGNTPVSFNVLADGNGVVGAFAPIAEGITAGEVSAIPESASAAAGLGLLALGAAGLRRRRALAAGRN